MTPTQPPKKILVTGATGYIGGRLIPELLRKKYFVRAVSRNLSKLKARSWAQHPQVELVEADALDKNQLEAACTGIDVAYYLVHSMVPGQDNFEEADRVAATNMTQAAEHAGLKRIIYLSGLGDEAPNLSTHLKSRTEVGHILSQGRVATTILRAAMIIGSGSASFEILRYLVERLPWMITPKWLKTPCQPIAVRNVINYLVGCVTSSETSGHSFDIGGPDILTYRQLMDIYAEEAHLKKRVIVPIPILTPRLSSYWIHIVTPVPSSIARPLAEGLKNPVICREDTIKKIIPQDLLTCREAIRLALERSSRDQVVSRWTDAGELPPFEWSYEGDPTWSGGTLFKDQRSKTVQLSADRLWSIISQIGGSNGWYYANWLWKIRGLIDRVVGGVGLSRGRRNAKEIMMGDALDFWRVLEVEKNKKLILAAEMKLPGDALLKFEINALKSGESQLTQTALFKPRGVLGLLYWYAVTPFHHFVFQGMLERIIKLAQTSTVDIQKMNKNEL